MFNEKRTLPFLNHGNHEELSFKGKRFVFDKASPEAPKGQVEAIKPPTDAEREKVLKDLQSGPDLVLAWDKSKDPDKNLEKFGKDLYAENPSQAAYASKVLKESLKWGNAETFAADKTKLKDCQNMRIKDGKVQFYKGKPGVDEKENAKIEIKLSTTDVSITTPKEAGGAAPELEIKDKETAEKVIKDKIKEVYDKYKTMDAQEFKGKFSSANAFNGAIFDELMEFAKRLPGKSKIGPVGATYKDISVGNGPGVSMMAVEWPSAMYAEKMAAVEKQINAAGKLSEQQMAAFKKMFPNAKPGDIKISQIDTVTPGSKGWLHFAGYGEQVSEADYFTEDGTARRMNPSNFEIGKHATVEIQSGVVIEAPKANGTMGKFVLAKIKSPEIGTGQKEFIGWVETGKLRQGNHEFKTENDWNKPPEFLGNVDKGDYSALGDTFLYHDSGLMIRNISKGEKLTITKDKVRKVGQVEFVYVTYESKGKKDSGWARKDLVVAPKAESLAKEAAFVETKDEKMTTDEKVAKYYNRSTGIIDFGKDKTAENTIVINDLFPGAKAGDKISIKHKAGGNTMEAEYKDKPFNKWEGGKTRTYPGTFYYKNGVRVEIWNGDRIVATSWGEEKGGEALADKEKRSYVEKVTLKPGDNYQDVAINALKNDQIKKAFEGTKFNEPQKVTAYVSLLKKYQQGNTLFLVIPTPDEAGIPTAQELNEAKFEAKGKTNKSKAERDSVALGEAFRQDLLKDVDRKITIKDSMIDIVSDEKKWNQAWNGEISDDGTKHEMAGLNNLIEVLRGPIFVQAGITEQNAQEKVRGLIKEYSDKEVDMEDIVNYFKIYIKEDGSAGSYSEFKSELNEMKPYMQEFEAKRGEMLKQTESFLVIQEKVRLAGAQGLDPYALFTKQDMENYNKAQEILSSPEYKRMVKIGYLNRVLEAGSRLLTAIGQLEYKESKVAKIAAPEKMTDETQKCVDALAGIFSDPTMPKGTKFSWGDAMAGKSEDEAKTSDAGKYFSENAPVLRIRSRLNKYTDDKGVLDGVERMNEADTVKELNRLMRKGLERIILWKPNAKEAMEFLNKYSTIKVDLPQKNPGEDDKDYATRLALLIVPSVETAAKELKINSLADLQAPPDAPAAMKDRIKDQTDVIKMGYYHDTRDEEKGYVEAKEGDFLYSMDQNVAAAQKAFEKQYGTELGKQKTEEKMKKIENIFLGGIAVKVDTTKPAKNAVGIGLGTGFDLGDGFTIMVGVGVDSIADHPQPILGVAIRKGWKLSEDKRTEIGVTAGPVIGLTGPSVGVGVDLTFPISGTLDMKLFAGGSIGVLVSSVGGGIGIVKNLDATKKDWEKEIAGFDTAEIDKETDPDKKYALIINNPNIGPFFRTAAAKFTQESQKKFVLDSYDLWRRNVENGAVKKTDAPFVMGGGIFAGAVQVAPGVWAPYVGPYLVFNFGKDTVVYRQPSEESKQMEGISEAKIQEAMQKDLQKKYPGQNIKFSETKAGQSGDVMVGGDGKIRVLKDKTDVDLSQFKDKPSVEKYNEALAPHDMKFVPDAATGMLELQIYGALGNLQILMDPGMEKKGLILKDNKVYLAPGANPDLFISRQEFFTPFPQQGSEMETVVTISDTPKRTRADIKHEVTATGSYLYRPAGTKDWQLVSAPKTMGGNVMDGAQYEKDKAKYAGFSEKIEGFDDAQWKAYKGKIDNLPFVKEPEPDLNEANVKELKDFSKRFLGNWANLQKYKEYGTILPGDSEAVINEKRVKLAELLQKEAGAAAPPKGKGVGHALSDVQMNFVMSELMDLSFSELEKAPDKRARFEQNLEWSKHNVILPFFRKKIPELKARGINITSSPEELADLLVKRLLADVKNDELGKTGTKFDGKTKETSNWVWSSVAGAIGTGLRGVAGYVTQEKYGFLGVRYEDISKPGTEGDLAKVILEMESPLDKTNDKNFAESILAKKMMGMPGMWFVLGDAMANQAADGMKEALDGKPVSPKNKDGFEQFKTIVAGVRETQLKGGNSYIVNMPNGNSFEFRINTKVADAAHARCGNASFGVTEDVQIFARIKPGEGMIVAAGATETATVTPQVAAKFYTAGLAGVVVVEVGKPEAPPPIVPPPPKQPPPVTPPPAAGPGGKVGVDTPGKPTTPTPTGGGSSE